MQTDIPESRSPGSGVQVFPRALIVPLHGSFARAFVARRPMADAAGSPRWRECRGLPRDKVVHSSRTLILHRFTALPLSLGPAGTRFLLSRFLDKHSRLSVIRECRPSPSLPLEGYLGIFVIDFCCYQLPLSRFTLSERSFFLEWQMRRIIGRMNLYIANWKLRVGLDKKIVRPFVSSCFFQLVFDYRCNVIAICSRYNFISTNIDNTRRSDYKKRNSNIREINIPG